MQIRNIPLDDICPSSLNPRKTFDQESLYELSENIKENGLIQPITVRKLPKDNEHKYEIVCGERRYRATRMAGLEEIQCVIKDLDDKQAFAAMIIENLQRKDVDPIEEAAAFAKLYEDGTMKVAEIAKLLGKSTTYVIGRIKLNKLIPEFVELLHNNTLQLIHMLEICKLTETQQKILYEDCFSPSCIARWTQKILKLDLLREMIDEHAMNFLDTAKFSQSDGTFTCGKDCEGCPLNTKNNPESYKDAARPRCMDAACYRQKTQEHIFRTAKSLEMPIVYQGDNNEDIIKAAEEFGLSLVSMTGRQYVLCPKEPDKASFTDEEFYEKRMQAYRHVKAIFDSNMEDGSVEQVYELCFDGKLSGEYKYAYSIPKDKTEAKDLRESDMKKEQLTKLKDAKLKTFEKECEEVVEKKRSALESSAYSSLNTFLSAEEQRIFIALLLKRLSQEFKKSIGLEWKNTESWFKDNAAVIDKNRNAIKREFVKSMLSEKSVCYSHDLEGLLTSLMEDQFASDATEVENTVAEKYRKQREKIQKEIEELKADGKESSTETATTEPTVEEVCEESQSEVSVADNTEATDFTEAEVVE